MQKIAARSPASTEGYLTDFEAYISLVLFQQSDKADRNRLGDIARPNVNCKSIQYGCFDEMARASNAEGRSPIAEGIELLEPQLVMLGDQALILRGYERLRNDEGPFTALQEWRCEPV